PVRPALSGSVAEAAALEAALRAGQKRRDDRADRAAGRRIPLRQRHSRLRGLDLDAAHALAGIHLDRRAGRRSAAALARLVRSAVSIGTPHKSASDATVSSNFLSLAYSASAGSPRPPV